MLDAHNVAERQWEAASSRLEEWGAAVREAAQKRASREERLAQLESRSDELLQSKVDSLSRLVSAADTALERGDAARVINSLAEACAQTRRLVRHLDAT
mmetsp:Transcript_28988/g.94453  ORF Transcript_28988/g.94453 Transcript_28988/m.94453 type:complete len:99 (+) Transcript_28988:770-1066(+)